ncbi:MAG TPA: L,D-transpeptidase family protein [Croceibacterium sp.]|nr:L,D-transpeptidase family protein [Croceibacterium sp.]
MAWTSPTLAAARSLVRCAILPTLLLASAPAAAAPGAPAELRASLAAQAGGELKTFYAYHSGPLWVTGRGTLDPAARELLRLIETARDDGLDPQALGARPLAEAIERAEAERSPAALARAELALSGALTRYARALLSPPGPSEMLYEHDVLRPVERTPLTILQAAADAPSLGEYLETMPWMHPLYAQVRRDLLAGQYAPPVRQAAIATLQRIRAIPAPPWSRHVVIDTASARLWMYEGDRPVDSMKVVVGKPERPTPMMAGYIRDAVINPYWNVPEHLVRQTIAPGVLSQGVAYLRARGYDVLSDWSDNPERLDPARIDWRAVRDGRVEVRVRQRPGAANAMGQVKYEFPNAQGIYLHDTPDKNLLEEEARQFSNGCVRLEDAERLGRWLLGTDLPKTATSPEQHLDLAQPVPIYITYLTVRPEGDRLVAGADPYGWDASGRALARAH